MLYASSQPIALETTMLALYNNAYSTCSQKVHVVLAEKSLEWLRYFEEATTSAVRPPIW